MDVLSNATDTLDTTSADFGFYAYIISKFHENEVIFSILEIIICVVGLILNSLTIDVSGKISKQTSATKWMRYLAWWDNSRLAFGLFRRGSIEIFGNNVLTRAKIGCKMFSYFSWLTLVNSSAHLVCLAVDRALSITFPIWHFKKEWNKLAGPVSWAVTLYHCVLLLPLIYVHNVENNVCKIMTVNFGTAVRIYQILLSTLFSSVGHFLIVLAASAVFIYQIIKRKKKVPPRMKTRQKGKKEKSAVPAGSELSHFSESKISESFARKTDENNDETRFVADEFDRSLEAEHVCGVRMQSGHSGENHLNIPENRVVGKKGKKYLHDTQRQISTNENSVARQDAQGFTSDVIMTETSSQEVTRRDETELRSSAMNRNLDPESRIPGKEVPGKLPSQNVKTSVSLSNEERNLVTTVLLICVWYLVMTWIASVFYLRATFTPEVGRFEIHGKLFLFRMSRIFTQMNNSFNFFFYLRGNSFRGTFVRRWLPKLRNRCP